jgi:hypothetical protein
MTAKKAVTAGNRRWRPSVHSEAGGAGAEHSCVPFRVYEPEPDWSLAAGITKRKEKHLDGVSGPGGSRDNCYPNEEQGEEH